MVFELKFDLDWVLFWSFLGNMVIIAYLIVFNHYGWISSDNWLVQQIFGFCLLVFLLEFLIIAIKGDPDHIF